jgi:hypothetical protein
MLSGDEGDEEIRGRRGKVGLSGDEGVKWDVTFLKGRDQCKFRIAN